MPLTLGRSLSPQHSHFVGFDQVKVDLRAQTRFGDCVNQTIFVVFDILYQPVLLQLGWQQNLKHLRILDRHRAVQISNVHQRVTAMVNLVIHMKSLR